MKQLDQLIRADLSGIVKITNLQTESKHLRERFRGAAQRSDPHNEVVRVDAVAAVLIKHGE